MLIFAGVTEPLGHDPEWVRFEVKLRLLRFYAALDTMRAFTISFSAYVTKAVEAFARAEAQFARLARIIEAEPR